MKTRLISVAIMLPLLVFLFLGKIPLLCACLVLSVLALKEFYDGFKNLEIKCAFAVGIAAAFALYAALFASCFIVKDLEFYEDMLPMWFFLIFIACTLMILCDPHHNILGPTYTFFGIIYILLMVSYIVMIDNIAHRWVWMPFIIAYMSDTGGYLIGCYFGTHKIAPILSPKKTREGSIGGIAFGIIGSLIFALIAARQYIILCLVLGLVGSILAELGDLVASAFKRKMGIKDYSNLIPGHGGIMDRIDSVLFTAPVVYAAVNLFVR